MRLRMCFQLYLLICFVPFTLGVLDKSNGNLSVVTRPFIRKIRAPGSSVRLSLINYRFSKPPKRKNIDPKELKLILGSSFDPQFMAIEEPPETAVIKENTWQFNEILGELHSSNFSQELQQLADDHDIQLKPEHIQLVEGWLIKRASCPVRYAWEDLGAMFWPRYIRRGECSGVLHSCSWPSGMNCVPSDTTTVTILRWQCKPPKGKGKRRTYRRHIGKELFLRGEARPLSLKCHWVQVPYPITSECMCTC